MRSERTLRVTGDQCVHKLGAGGRVTTSGGIRPPGGAEQRLGPWATGISKLLSSAAGDPLQQDPDQTSSRCWQRSGQKPRGAPTRMPRTRQ